MVTRGGMAPIRVSGAPASLLPRILYRGVVVLGLTRAGVLGLLRRQPWGWFSGPGARVDVEERSGIPQVKVARQGISAQEAAAAIQAGLVGDVR